MTFRFCQDCGTEYSAATRFCPTCGARRLADTEDALTAVTHASSNGNDAARVDAPTLVTVMPAPPLRAIREAATVASPVTDSSAPVSTAAEGTPVPHPLPTATLAAIAAASAGVVVLLAHVGGVW